MNATRQTLGGACLALGCITTSIAAAEPRPLLVPTHDVRVVYQVTPEGRPPIEVVVAIKGGGTRLRITSEELPTMILVDRTTEQASIVVPLLHAYSDIKIDRYDPEQTVLRNARFTRVGTQNIYGLPCTDWRATSNDGTAQACITKDGIILQAEVENEKHRKSVRLEATTVDRAPVPEADFALPAGFQRSPFKLNLKGGLGK